MRAKKTETQIRREQIAQAGLSLVASQGLKGLSMAGVASQVGLVASAIYRHFKNKDQMIDAILNLIRDKLMDNIKEVCDETPDSLERLERLLMRHTQLILENQGIPRIVFSEDVYNGRPQRKAKMHGIVKEHLDAVEDIVRQGQQEGMIRSDIDAVRVSVMFLGLIQPPMILWHLSEGKFDLIKQAEEAWRIFGSVIASQKSATARSGVSKED
jgi:AcrR family transcriptional regulator